MLLAASDTDAQSHARQGYEYARQGQLANAERELRESIRLAPENGLYHSALAGILQRGSRLEESAAEYAKALEGVPKGAMRERLAAQLEQVDLQWGAELAKSARYNAGLTLATDAAQRFPQSAPVLRMLGYFQSKRRMNVAAVSSYLRALELDPSSAEANLGLGMAQSAAGLNVDAVKTLERFPNDVLHVQALGSVLLASGNAEGARAQFEAALKLNAGLAEAHLQLGNLALERGDLESAKMHLLAAAPEDSRVHFALSRLYRRTGDAAGAAREMQAFEAAR